MTCRTRNAINQTYHTAMYYHSERKRRTERALTKRSSK